MLCWYAAMLRAALGTLPDSACYCSTKGEGCNKLATSFGSAQTVVICPMPRTHYMVDEIPNRTNIILNLLRETCGFAHILVRHQPIRYRQCKYAQYLCGLPWEYR